MKNLAWGTGGKATELRQLDIGTGKLKGKKEEKTAASRIGHPAVRSGGWRPYCTKNI